MSTISSGTTLTTALVQTGDTTGTLVIQTNGTTTAATFDASQILNLTNPLPVASGGTGTNTVGTAGNVLTSNGTAWVSQAPATFAETVTPTNSSPANGATNQPAQTVLTSSTFFTAYNGVTHSASQWQVSTVANFATTVVNTGDDVSNLTSYTISYGVLSTSTTYYWRVRYKNSRGVYSDWSTGTSFVTASVFRVVSSLTISSNSTNYTLNTAKVAGYAAGLTDVTLTINSGVSLGSTSTSTYALDVATGWSTGDTITIVNNGNILGIGGAGGSNSGGASTTGGNGGPALRVQYASSINNLGIIGGGGGGGGGGAGNYEGISGGGGGGGAGWTNGTNGTGYNNGTSGGTSSGGGGGSGYGGCGGGGSAGAAGSNGGNGGNCTGQGARYTGGGGGGGGLGGAGGSSGGATANGFYPPGASGGAAGACIVGNSNITWIATGTRYGSIS